ncbi:sensor histidine kinase [Paenibacillus sp. LHD-117]|uniref:sensor histidine kinase n=1 Tax=Paenibacillus sp. LHD-117 TaxID=3071412 RepID=UPI0027DF5D00|nr:sensor histidine kinase [Paenibacillus sp. LHD-117]MDQ6418728.1 sensor histidine kinase [Paenibacillus sp. LHD-117]
MIASFYRRRIRNSLFAKWILLFALIAVVSIVTVAVAAYSYMSQSVVEDVLDNQKKTMDAVGEELARSYESVQGTVENLYRNRVLADHASFLLQHSFDEYIRHKLESFYEQNGEGVNVLAYFDNWIDDHPNAEHLLLYSSEKQFLYAFKQQGQSKLIGTHAVSSYIPDAMSLDVQPVGLPNAWLLKELGKRPHESGLISMRVPINDNDTYKNIGQLLVFYRNDAIDRIVRRIGGEQKGSILVLSADGFVLYDSSGSYTGERHPNADILKSLDAEERLKEKAYVNKLTNSQAGYTVVGIAPKAEVAEAYRGFRLAIVLAAAASIFFVVFVPGALVVNYAKRTGNIIRFMRKVEQGELSPRIPDVKDDELGQISRSFNEMLDELSRYIDRVYKAEIREKRTEFAALQARVNPHFLYNTLEVIRMRALSQGAEDVAEMIYSLSALFRNVVRDKPVYTVKDEIEMCRLYLELFRIRYKDKFAYSIKVKPGSGGVETMKLLLQPVIENYIVHGMRHENEDNRIEIEAFIEGEKVRIEVRDNGTGIPEEKLKSINARPDQDDESGEGSSFGLRSVRERIQLIYGDEGGLTVENREGGGARVTLSFPARKGEQGLHV